MIYAEKHNGDTQCPWCKAWLQVEDGDDFAEPVEEEFMRNMHFTMRCPECERDMVVDVDWEPCYGDAHKTGVER